MTNTFFYPLACLFVVLSLLLPSPGLDRFAKQNIKQMTVQRRKEIETQIEQQKHNEKEHLNMVRTIIFCNNGSI